MFGSSERSRNRGNVLQRSSRRKRRRLVAPAARTDPIRTEAAPLGLCPCQRIRPSLWIHQRPGSGREGARGLGTLSGIAAKRSPKERVQRRIALRQVIRRGRDIFGAEFDDDVTRVGAIERYDSGDHSIKDARERPKVTACIDDASAGMLRAHVGRRAQHQPLSGLTIFGNGCLRDPEVQQFDQRPRTLASEEEIARLDVTMHDPFFVHEGQPFAGFFDQGHRMLDGQWALTFQILVEILTLEQLHDEIGDVTMDPEIVNLNDVGALELRGCPRLPTKSSSRRFVANDIGSEHFDRDIHAQIEMMSAPHRPHAASRKVLFQLVFFTNDLVG